jgi:hypothetical protein
MTTFSARLLDWGQSILPVIPLLAGRRKPGVHWLARNGAEITLRIVRDSDADRIQAFVRGLSMMTRYHRFFYRKR